MSARAKRALALVLAALAPAAAGAQQDPVAVARVGKAYAAAHLDLANTLAIVASLGDRAPAIDARRWHFRFRTAVDDAVRDRIAASLAPDDASYRAVERAIRDQAIDDQATQMVRGYAMRENDLADVIAVALAIASNANGSVAATPAAVAAASKQIHVALAYSPGAAALDDAGKQTIVTELLYQMVFWQSDWATAGFGSDAAATNRLRASIATSLATLGFAPGSWTLGATGLTVTATKRAR